MSKIPDAGVSIGVNLNIQLAMDIPFGNHNFVSPFYKLAQDITSLTVDAWFVAGALDFTSTTCNASVDPLSFLHQSPRVLIAYAFAVLLNFRCFCISVAVFCEGRGKQYRVGWR